MDVFPVLPDVHGELNVHLTSVWSTEKGRGPDVAQIGLMGVVSLASSLGCPVSERGLKLGNIAETSPNYPQVERF